VRPSRPARWLPASLLVLAAAPPVAHADTRPILDGWRSSALSVSTDAGAPPVRTSVRVDRSALAFSLSPDLASASVHAAYLLTNAGPEPEAMDLAFSFAGGDRGDDPTAHTFLELDGAPFPFRTATEVDPTGGAHLRHLIFHVDFAPGQPLMVAVHFTQQATEDRTVAVNSTYRFDHLLSPARRWAGFGPFDVSIRVPPGARFSSSFPFASYPFSFVHDADGYRADVPGLPGGDLHFEVTPLSGLWLRMTRPPGYWAVTVAGLAAASVAVGAASGQRWGRAAGGKRAALPLLAAGALAAVSALAVLVLLLAASPPHALGFGYAGVLRGVLLAVLAGPLGAGAAAASARAARRRRTAAEGARKADPDVPGPPAPAGKLE
jgi:hypothetical protein